MITDAVEMRSATFEREILEELTRQQMIKRVQIDRKLRPKVAQVAMEYEREVSSLTHAQKLRQLQGVL